MLKCWYCHGNSPCKQGSTSYDSVSQIICNELLLPLSIFLINSHVQYHISFICMLLGFYYHRNLLYRKTLRCYDNHTSPLLQGRVCFYGHFAEPNLSGNLFMNP